MKIKNIFLALTLSLMLVATAYAEDGLPCAPGKLISANTTNATLVKSSRAKLCFLTVSNVNAAARYLHFYDTSSSPTVGTTPVKLVFMIPGNTAGAGTNVPLPDDGLYFGSGIAFSLTTGGADTDTNAVAASELIVNYGYK